MTDTREKILHTALRLFAAKGYKAVSVLDIAGELGMTKGALYKHFRNKRDIFDSIVGRMEQRDAEQAIACGMPAVLPAAMDGSGPADAVDHIVAFSRAMFRYWTQDDFAAQFRKMLTIEQFGSTEMGKLYQQYLCSGPVEYMTDVFVTLGLPRPREKAVAFYAPMFLLYSVYDGSDDKKAILALMDDLLESARVRLTKER